MIFEIPDRDIPKIQEWVKTHSCSQRGDPEDITHHYPSIFYVFHQTGIGLHIEIRCSCGAKLDITDYASW